MGLVVGGLGLARLLLRPLLRIVAGTGIHELFIAAALALVVGSALAILTYLSGNRILSDYLQIPHVIGCGELTVVLGALVGAMLGFFYRARKKQ